MHISHHKVNPGKKETDLDRNQIQDHVEEITMIWKAEKGFAESANLSASGLEI